MSINQTDSAKRSLMLSVTHKLARKTQCELKPLFSDSCKIACMSFKMRDFKSLHFHTHTHSFAASSIFSTTSQKHTGGIHAPAAPQVAVALEMSFAISCKRFIFNRLGQKQTSDADLPVPHKTPLQDIAGMGPGPEHQLCSASSRRRTCCRSCRSSARARSRLAMRQRISRANLSML
jgi:hypothetical protein